MGSAAAKFWLPHLRFLARAWFTYFKNSSFEVKIVSSSGERALPHDMAVEVKSNKRYFRI
jgi:hypothetical protein